MTSFAGFDTSVYPGDAVMRWLRDNTNLVWCGYYFGRTPSHSGVSWMGKRTFLESLAWGLAPLYLGQELVGPGSHHTSGAQGAVDGAQAADMAKAEAFAPGSILYLDLENGFPFPEIQKNYVMAWSKAVQQKGYSAGIYCSHVFAADVAATVPDAFIWAFKVPTTKPHTVPGPFYPDPSPVGSGYSGAFIWQLGQHCIISLPRTLGGALEVDLDSASTQNPSVPGTDFGSMPSLGAKLLAPASRQMSAACGYLIDDSSAVLGDEDPAAPLAGQWPSVVDLGAAIKDTNFGVRDEDAQNRPLAPNGLVQASVRPFDLEFDLQRAQAFLKACETSSPRVAYGLGAKIPSLTAIPGRDFRKVDCSGFVRHLIRLATTPTASFPDGSVVQHDWVRSHQFEGGQVADGAKNDGVVRLAFLSPKDSPIGIGHVALVAGGQTLESHGGVGPDSRRWTGRDWQAKADIFVLGRAATTSASRQLLTLAFDQGQHPTIACVNLSTLDLGVDWSALVTGLGDYVSSFFSPVWGTPARVIDAGSGPVPDGAWGLIFLDNADQPNALGYHDLTAAGLPLSKIFVADTLRSGEKVSITASHEIAEMLIDPGIQMGAIGPDGTTWYAYETADAVEREQFDVNGIPMSNFVFPSWFESFRAPHSTRFDHLNRCTRPFELRPGGYISVYKDGAWSQIFGSSGAENAFNLPEHPRAMTRGRLMRYGSRPNGDTGGGKRGRGNACAAE